jgi:hypothetical protein
LGKSYLLGITTTASNAEDNGEDSNEDQEIDKKVAISWVIHLSYASILQP